MMECARCGGCCKSDMMAYVSDEDRDRWAREGRHDILTAIDGGERVWAGDRIVYQNGSGSLSSCTFLRWEGDKTWCAIYETRPRVCSDFLPGKSLLCTLHK